MVEQTGLSQEERTLAAAAHGSILIGLATSGLGGIGAALLIWLAQKEKSPYAAFQALQATIYQAVAFVVTVAAWGCWGMTWLAMILPPVLANPTLYENNPPAGLWLGLVLMLVPIAVSTLGLLYALWGAVRCLGGHDFRYILIGRWLESQK
jgi:uncharacterized Tic20 family protein